MKIIKTDWKAGILKLELTNSEDTWVLSQVVEPGDIITSKTLRKIKIGGGENERSSSIVKRPVVLTLNVTKIQMAPERDALRVSGTVTQGPEDIPLGSYHTISLSEHSTFTLQKNEWLFYQKERVTNAAKNSGPGILICIHDREEAIIAESGPDKYHILTTLKGQVAKKYAEQTSTDFYSELIIVLKEYNLRKNPAKIIIASPAFWKEDLMKKVSDLELKKKIVLATVSSVSNNAIDEVLSRPETKTALISDRISSELKIVDELLAAIASEKPSTYGPKQVKVAADSGAIEVLLISDNLLTKYKEDERFSEIESTLKMTEKSKGKVMIISSAHEGGKKLDGIGGIAAILRFSLNNY